MSIDYDAWLEAPYQEMCEAEDEWEWAEQQVRDDDSYAESLSEWLDENAGMTEADYIKSSRYTRLIESTIRNYNDYRKHGE